MSDEYGLAPICFRCRNYLGVVPGFGYTCRAYDGRQIPIEIIVSSADHRYSYEGDGGIVFEPIRDDFDNLFPPCELVEGDISPGGWCEKWEASVYERQMVLAVLGLLAALG
jgi:hypothetical protein